MADQQITIDETHLTVWEERDRLHIALYMKSDELLNDPLLDLWDDAASEAFEDGFLKAGFLKDNDPALKQSAFEYAKSQGRLDPANRTQRESLPTGWAIVHDELGALITWKAGPEYVWSSEATEEQLAKGAVLFSDETDSSGFLKVDSDDEAELKENAELLSHISVQSVTRDITPSGHTMPRRASLESLREGNIDLKIASASLTI
jgi:hypothetical protein